MEQRHYYSLNQYMIEQFGERVHRVPVNAGFTCPNRDGTKGINGCIYCNSRGAGAQWLQSSLSVKEQLLRGIIAIKKRFKVNKFIAYFQAFSNTYGSLSYLQSLYQEALEVPGIVGLAIGTRPDVVPDATLDLIEKFAQKTHVWLEYGLQSIHDASLQWMKRGHGFKEFRDAIARTQGRSILPLVHIIVGLPGETRQDMMITAETIAALPLHGIKIHHLYVSSDSPLAKLYSDGSVKTIDEDYFIQLVADIIERLPPSFVVHRLMGDCEPAYLIAPQWTLQKARILRKIDAEFERRKSFQGFHYQRFCKTALNEQLHTEIKSD